MKRRTFLTAAGTVGIIGVASSASTVSSVYSSLSTRVLLEEFDAPSKNALDKFIKDVNANAESLGLNASFAKRLAMPVQIISKNSNKEGNNLLYKNKAGKVISISVSNGKGSLRVLD